MQVKVRYVASSDDSFTNNKIYEALNGLHPEGINVTGLVIDDNGFVRSFTLYNDWDLVSLSVDNLQTRTLVP
jgi:hypothetical protein